MQWNRIGIDALGEFYFVLRGMFCRHKWCVFQSRGLMVLLVGVVVGVISLPNPALADDLIEIKTPQQARLKGLESLRLAVKQDGGVPLSDNLDDFIKDRKAAIQLGKALFWDMQVGSDGVQACASCHFHAGADNRARNALNPDLLTFLDERDGDVQGYFNSSRKSDTRFETKPPDGRLTRNDFPLVRSIQALVRNVDGTIGPGVGNSNDIAGSMGMLFTRFDGIRPGVGIELGTSQPDPIWNINGATNVRRVEPRNTPTVINAVFNFTNFWDGRANPHFNGQTSFGDQDQTAAIVVNTEAGLAFAFISLDNASLASQALSPLLSFSEMSFGDPAQKNGRILLEIGMKLIRPSETGSRLIPLGLQKVHRHDAVLGNLSNLPARGLSMSYEQMIQRAFKDKYWNSAELLDTPEGQQFTHMEGNFGLFFGLAVMLYQSTLVADQSAFDRWMETGRFNKDFGKHELAGLNLFVNQGQCITCHGGAELTNASVRAAKGGTKAIRAMAMAEGVALYDNGFYNISVTPTTDDIGRGDKDSFNQPLAFSRQALFSRLGVAQFPFRLLGNDQLPAIDEDGGAAVCDDANADGVCAPSEAMRPEFKRAAVDGSFKTPGLRNVELTGPYFHNGGMATLRQVVQFYNRGGNFCDFNRRDLDPAIKPLGLSAHQEKELVAFLVSLTDRRVTHRQAPFDHPELRIPKNGPDPIGTQKIKGVGAKGSKYPLKPFLNLNPQDPIFTPPGMCVQQGPGSQS